MKKTHASLGRRHFLTQTAGLAGLASFLPARAIAAEGEAPAAAATTPEAAAQQLRAGNARFVAGTPTCRDLSNRRAELVGGQSPFAIIVSCSDSRVPVETIFDQEPGHVFGVRVAGNFVDPAGLGSIEYAVAVLKASYILVIGHEACGAVKAAIEYVKEGKKFPGSIQRLAEAIAPAAKASKSMPGKWVHNATAQNVRDTVASVPKRSTIVADAISAGKLGIAGAVYELASGKVTML
ncbi:MAG: carbonic anhydrase [Candidatus Eremiobacteraeota bacterium]|nr:carbonic anhydrase [Candidatus Eremiobacteraeota bacterium]